MSTEIRYKMDKLWASWELRNITLTEADFLWITSNSESCGVDREVHTFNNLRSQGSPYPIQVSGNLTVRITTKSQQQETMLKLKYGDNLLLMSYTCQGTIPNDAFK